MALAHEDEDEVRGAYNSALYLTPRRRMLQSWADVIDAALPVDAAAQQDCRPAPEPISSRAAGLATIRPLPPAEQRRPYWHRPPGGLRRATVRPNMPDYRQIGRAACRERVWQYV